MLTKTDLDDEIAFNERHLIILRKEMQDMLDGKREKNCLQDCLIYATEIRLSTLQEIQKKYYAPRVYDFCDHCGARWIKTNDDPRDVMCPKCDRFAHREKSI